MPMACKFSIDTIKFLESEPLYVEAYYTLFSVTGIHFLNEGNSISRDDYAKIMATLFSLSILFQIAQD